MRVLIVVGARPNFMKAAPIVRSLQGHGDRFVVQLVHTGQHYDQDMSESFFSDLGMPRPDVNLGVGSGSHAEQTARVMVGIEPVLKEFSPDLVIVVGDVNSTLACALTAKKMGLRVAHVEAGLRSFDRTMPEEINRICTDAIADILFTTEAAANENLRREGVSPDRIHFVGNVMIDSLMGHLDAARRLAIGRRFDVAPGRYATLTLHRPANVDRKEKLAEILGAIADGLSDMPIIFAAHPRTRQRIDDFGLQALFSTTSGTPGLHLAAPLGYMEFLGLNAEAAMVVTDSGGLQEETTILGVSCVTVRGNTERPVTIERGTNRLAGTGRAGILAAIAEAKQEQSKDRLRPDLWDGHAAERIVNVIGRMESSMASRE